MAKRLREESISSHLEDDGSADSGTASPEPEAHTPKYTSLEPTESSAKTMRCSLPSHKPLSFATYAEYESHYQQAHTNRCTECKKNFPTSHFLDLHIAENHDPIVASKRERGEKTYACFVEGCEKVCGEWTRRRRHLVDKHSYPKNYDFLVVDNGIDGRRSMLRPGIDAQGHRKSSRERERSDSSVSETTQATEDGSVGKPNGVVSPAAVKAEGTSREAGKAAIVASTEETSVDDLTSSMSALKMVPRSITFGKRRGRGGFAKS